MDGLLIVDKPAGMSSHDVVNQVRRLFDEKSIGHLGTLDPLATGVLPLLIGRYTRLAQYFGNLDKEYTGRIRFGFSTDTYDCEGTPTSDAVPISLEEQWLRTAVAAMHGDIQQVPPLYSAKKIKGVPAHRLARKGQTPEMKPVTIRVEQFTAAVITPDTAEFRVTVSSGGYVRCLAHDLGQQLGSGAHLIELRRIRAGSFCISQSVTLDDLIPPDRRATHLAPGNAILPRMPAIRADAQTLLRIRNGMQVNLPEFSSAPLVRVLSSDGNIAAIARRLAGTLFAPQTVLA